MFVIYHTYTNPVIVLTQYGPLMDVVIIVGVLGFVIHPPIKNLLWCEITTTSINYFPATATVAIVCGTTHSKTYSIPSPGSICRSMAVSAMAGHIPAMIPGGIYETVGPTQKWQAPGSPGIINQIYYLLFFSCQN